MLESSNDLQEISKNMVITYVFEAFLIGMAVAAIFGRVSMLFVQNQMFSQQTKQEFYQALIDKNGAVPTNFDKQKNVLKASWLDTPIGSMLAIADDEALDLLEFVDRRGLEKEIERLRIKTKSAIIPGDTQPIHSIKGELAEYFFNSNGELGGYGGGIQRKKGLIEHEKKWRLR